MAGREKPRYIGPGACSWCGHKPHASGCASTIRTRIPMPHGRDASTGCPCTAHLSREQRIEAAEDRAEQAAYDAARERS
jgi:hypothetical protein